MLEDHDINMRLARGIRRAREAQGFAVTELAQHAGMSRRMLTEIEAGRANPSLSKLVGLARALGLELPELFEATGPRRQRERIALVGLRGAGKSTIGRLLAREFEVPFIELDERVELRTGLSLMELYDLHGRAALHRYEGEALEQVLAEGGRQIIATGSAIVDSERNFGRLCATCRTVWVSADADDHFDRVQTRGDRRPGHERPGAREELVAILKEREPLYARTEIRLHTSGRTIEESLAELAGSLVRQQDV